MHLCAAALLLFPTGCSFDVFGKQIVLTTGFRQDELFKLEGQNCMLGEALVYLSNMRNSYEKIYGEEIWSSQQGGVFAVTVRENALALISQIKAMNLLAVDNSITLSDEEERKVREAADEYFGSLGETERKKLRIDEDLVLRMYREYALAHKYYREIIKDIDLEVSDDEARTITIEQIFLRTYLEGPDGIRQEMSLSEKEALRVKAEELRALAADGEHEFSDLVLEYSDGGLSELSFSKGDTDPVFENAVFNLGTNEISEVIRTKDGYHIIKCLTTFNREETDLNKLKIADLSRQKVFGERYDTYVSTLITAFNDELWDSVSEDDFDGINTQSFFEIYHKYFD
ncbi:MAG: peptidylprolyl isomerase [Lachnospiraceae bacterium]|nr:peptidylprolyl isomerase [Lachnospiraceae bacterium]